MGYKKTLVNIARKCGYNISRIGDVDVLESLIYKRYNKDFSLFRSVPMMAKDLTPFMKRSSN